MIVAPFRFLCMEDCDPDLDLRLPQLRGLLSRTLELKPVVYHVIIHQSRLRIVVFPTNPKPSAICRPTPGFDKHLPNTLFPPSRAVFSALGASDVTDTHSELDPDIHSSTEDFLWLKLSGLSALAGEAQQSALAQLQTMLLEEYGEREREAEWDSKKKGREDWGKVWSSERT